MICIWAYNLIKSTTAILVDCEDRVTKEHIAEHLMGLCRIEELRVWAASEDKVNVIAKVEINNPEYSIEEIKHKISETADTASITIEVTSKVFPEVH